MAAQTLIQTLLAVVFATLGIVGFVVSIHPPKTPTSRRAYLCAFVALTAVGVVLVYCQSVLAERSQVVADKLAAELRRQVSTLYAMQVASVRRPTQDELNALADRVYVIRRDVRFSGRPNLKLEARLLSAEILLFVAQRSMAAPRIETFEASENASGLVDRMKSPPVTEPLTDDEALDEAHRRAQTTWMDPLGRVGLSAEESRWFNRNRRAIDYYFQTVHLFSERFGPRVRMVFGDLQKARAVDKWVVSRAMTEYQNNELGMREVALRLAEAAEKLP
jgi:hypothetical protein